MIQFLLYWDDFGNRIRLLSNFYSCGYFHLDAFLLVRIFSLMKKKLLTNLQRALKFCSSNPGGYLYPRNSRFQGKRLAQNSETI